jgi:hypothetical protein
MNPMDDLSPTSTPTPEPAGEVPAGEQSEFDLGVVATGNPGVDAALASLEGLGELPVVDHPDIYEQVHQELTQAMSEFAEDVDAGGADQ